MAYLARNEGIHQGALADVLEIEPITVVRIVDKLEEKGLVERRRHPTDRRIRLLFLTDAARQPLTKMRELGDLTRADALVGVTEADRDHLLQLLVQLKLNLIEACNSPAEDRAANHG